MRDGLQYMFYLRCSRTLNKREAGKVTWPPWGLSPDTRRKWVELDVLEVQEDVPVVDVEDVHANAVDAHLAPAAN